MGTSRAVAHRQSVQEERDIVTRPGEERVRKDVHTVGWPVADPETAPGSRRDSYSPDTAWVVRGPGELLSCSRNRCGRMLMSADVVFGVRFCQGGADLNAAFA